MSDSQSSSGNIFIGEADFSSFDDVLAGQGQKAQESLYLADRARIMNRIVRMFGLGVFAVVITTAYHLATQGGPTLIQGPKGDTGKGWTGGDYDSDTGIVTFESEDGIEFKTTDVRGEDGVQGKGWTGGDYDSDTGIVTFESEDGIEFKTTDVRGEAGAPSTVPGPQGKRGDSGPQGKRGEAGAPSTVLGPQGERGKSGPQGERGEAGTPSTVSGPTGPQGERGPKGELGPSGGPIGPQGERGDIGTQGVRGEVGPQGKQGDKGDTGKQGPQGKVGPKSEQHNFNYSKEKVKEWDAMLKRLEKLDKPSVSNGK